MTCIFWSTMYLTALAFSISSSSVQQEKRYIEHFISALQMSVFSVCLLHVVMHLQRVILPECSLSGAPFL